MNPPPRSLDYDVGILFNEIILPDLIGLLEELGRLYTISPYLRKTYKLFSKHIGIT